LAVQAFAALSQEHRLILDLNQFVTEVNNGAIVQYFWNSSGDHAEELIEHVRTLGCNALAESIEGARTEIFSGPVPPDINARRARMIAFFSTHPFNDDDDFERIEHIRPAPRSEEATSLFHRTERELLEAFREWALRNREEIERSP
jgi:hypothetical protein